MRGRSGVLVAPLDGRDQPPHDDQLTGEDRRQGSREGSCNEPCRPSVAARTACHLGCGSPVIRRRLAGCAVAVTVLSAISVIGAGRVLAAYPGPVGLIVFSSVDSHGTTHIWTIEPTTRKRRKLTTKGGENPCWSPFGTRIAFDRGGDLWVMSATGAHQHDITKTRNVTERDPSWSPDGRRLAYTRDLGGAVDIAVANADGSNRRTITSNKASDYSPAWSTTNRIAFVSDRSGRPQIWVMHANGTSEHNVSREASDDLAPAWSPDGTRIAYAGPLNPPHSVGGDLWTMKADGSGKTAIVHQKTYSDAKYPSWSPDGKTLEFSANNGLGALRLWTYSLRTGRQTQLTHETSQPYDSSGDWQPARTAQLALGRSSGRPGVTTKVTGAHFANREPVTLLLLRGTRRTVLATVHTGARGRFSTSVIIPRNASPGAAHVVATGSLSALRVRAAFTIT
jgi:TolB protein